MPFCIRTATVVVASLALAGCASQDLLVKRQAETEAKIEHLIQTDAGATRRMNELSNQLQDLEQRLRDSDTRIAQLQATLGEMRAQSEPTALAANEVAPRIEVVNRAPAPGGREGGPPAEYVTAFGLYSANNFNAAIQAFQSFLSHSPGSDYTPNAIYWIGECHYTLSDLPKAAEAFQKVVDGFPRSAKAPDALLKLGYTQASMGERGKATRTFESLVRKYPGSPAATRARERLTAH